jgi:hypothetical protein
VRRLLPELPLHGAPDWWVDAVDKAAQQMTFIPGRYSSNSTSDFSYTLFTRSPSQT